MEEALWDFSFLISIFYYSGCRELMRHVDVVDQQSVTWRGGLTPFFGEEKAVDGSSEVIWGVSDGGHSVAYLDTRVVRGSAIWFDSMGF